MIELKQYIEESLLDDFDTLASNQDKHFKDPFAYLFHNSVASNNWDRALEEFEEVIKFDSKEDHKNIRDYYGLHQKKPNEKGSSSGLDSKGSFQLD